MGNEDTNMNYQMFIDITSQIVRSHLEKQKNIESELIENDEQTSKGCSVCESEYGRTGRGRIFH